MHETPSFRVGSCRTASHPYPEARARCPSAVGLAFTLRDTCTALSRTKEKQLLRVVVETEADSRRGRNRPQAHRLAEERVLPQAVAS